MAPLNPNNTERWFLDYTTCGEEHTLLMRAGLPITAADATAALDTFLDAFGTTIQQLTVNGLRRSLAGQNISLPQPWTGAATYGSGVGGHAVTAQYVDFVGRSTGGRRVRVAVFGYTTPVTNNDYRITEAEQAAIGEVLDFLNSTEGVFVAIDGNGVLWQQYANTGFNAYWQREIR